MPLPQIFATVPTNTRVAGAQLDNDLNQVGTMGIMPCTATGTNVIALTPFSDLPDIRAYADYLRFAFVAPNTSTGAVTVNFSALGALPWYRGDGTTQLGAGDVIAGEYYDIAFEQRLNSGGGGFVGAGASFAGPIGPTGPTSGPTGPTGPGGPTGTTGPTGPAGTNAFTAIRVQRFTSSSTYTPDAHLLYATIEIVGGGGGGGGIAGAGANVVQAGGGGGAGVYNRKTVSAATIGVSQVVTVGAAGAGGVGSTPTNGGNGTATSVGAIVSAGGGSGGTTDTGTGIASSPPGGAGGTNSGGDFNAVGAMAGSNGIGYNPNNAVMMTIGGAGGSSDWGGGGRSPIQFTTSSAVGNDGQGYGAGGSGAAGTGDATARNGGAGTKGLVLITEFCSQ